MFASYESWHPRLLPHNFFNLLNALGYFFLSNYNRTLLAVVVFPMFPLALTISTFYFQALGTHVFGWGVWQCFGLELGMESEVFPEIVFKHAPFITIFMLHNLYLHHIMFGSLVFYSFMTLVCPHAISVQSLFSLHCVWVLLSLYFNASTWPPGPGPLVAIIPVSYWIHVLWNAIVVCFAPCSVVFPRVLFMSLLFLHLYFLSFVYVCTISEIVLHYYDSW